MSHTEPPVVVTGALVVVVVVVEVVVEVVVVGRTQLPFESTWLPVTQGVLVS